MTVMLSDRHQVLESRGARGARAPRARWSLALAILLLAGLHLAVRAARAVWPWGAPVAPALVEGPIMPAAGGRITDLAIQFHRPGPPPILEVYRELFAAIDPRTTVHVVVSDEEDQRLFEDARRTWAAPPRVQYARTGRPITSWIHDRLLVLDPPRANGALTLVAPPVPQRGASTRVHDWTVPWTVRHHLGPGARLETADFAFDGGDLIADERRVYLTTRLVRRNAAHFRSAGELARAVSEAVGRRALVLGTPERPAPEHHVGMFVTPLGGDQVVFGDPDLALALLRRAGVDVSSLVVGGETLPVDVSEAQLERFRGVARQLEAEGLAVHRIPLLPGRDDYVFVSYGNAMLERRDGVLHVHMPSYGIPALDEAALQAYEALGARVHPIRVDRVFRMGGSVGCLVAPLRRQAPVMGDGPRG